VVLMFVACSANPTANTVPTATLVNLPTAQPTPQATSGQAQPSPTTTSVAEPTGTPASPANGLLLEYARTGGIAGFCDHLQILANKQVIYKAGCRGEELTTTSNDARIQQAVDWSARVHT